jgi:hypothetical protein
MDFIQNSLAMLRDQPWLAVAAGIGMAGILYALLRKSRIERDAARDLERLRKERAGHYDKLRPPR